MKTVKPQIRDMVEIGNWIDLARYYVDSTGTVWCFNGATNGLTCEGNEDEFRETFLQRRRGVLYPKVSP